MDFSSIKNIIFDLGGVIINIDFQNTYNAFARLSRTDMHAVLQKFEEQQVFSKYEKGLYSDASVKQLFRELLNISASDKDLLSAWNAILEDIPKDRIALLQQLKSKYRTFLLSNTNGLHIQGVNQILYETSGIHKLDDLFEKVYYSFEVGMCKPDLKIYQLVLKENNLEAAETLFIDDNEDNIKGAARAGLNVIHVKAPQTILELLKNA